MTLHLARTLRSLTRSESAELRLIVADLRASTEKAIRTGNRNGIRNLERATKRWLRSTAKARGKARAHLERRRRKATALIPKEALAPITIHVDEAEGQ